MPASEADAVELQTRRSLSRGTLDQVNGNLLTIKTRSGAPTTVQLKEGALVIATVKGSMSDIPDIRDTSYVCELLSGLGLCRGTPAVGIFAMDQPDRTMKAVEVHVFAVPLRQWRITEGDLTVWPQPKGTGRYWFAVKKADKNTLKLNVSGTEITCVVPSDARILKLIPGDKADLVPGAQIVFPRWEKRADGTWEATAAIVGRDGIAPPM
jgi:hypothetical protein